MSDRWDPAQYTKFRSERAAPFEDVMALVKVQPGMRVIDLGCGTGELTARIADRLPGSTVHGVDFSDAMLDQARAFASDRVSFAKGDIAAIGTLRLAEYDLVFTHAAFQWVPDHERWMPALLAAMKPGAQLAVQMPHNFAQPSHTVALALAQDARFRAKLSSARAPGSLEMEAYAAMLFTHGFRDTVCFEKIYGHVFAHSRDVVEWNKGTLLTAYLPLLDPAERDAFIAAYEKGFVASVGERSPYLYTMRRLVIYARKDSADAAR